MFEIYVDGRNYPKDGVGFAIILKYGEHVWKRAIKCKKMTSNQAELEALLFALKSVKPNYKQKEMKIFTKNKYITFPFSYMDGKWTKPVESIEHNKDQISEIRVLLEEFKFVIIYDPNNIVFTETGKMVETVIKTGEQVFVRS